MTYTIYAQNTMSDDEYVVINRKESLTLTFDSRAEAIEWIEKTIMSCSRLSLSIETHDDF